MRKQAAAALVVWDLGSGFTRTEHSLMEASVLEIFVDQKSLVAFEAAAAELDEVAVLNTRDECDFVQEFVVPLLRFGGELLHCHLRAIWKNSLKTPHRRNNTLVLRT